MHRYVHFRKVYIRWISVCYSEVSEHSKTAIKLSLTFYCSNKVIVIIVNHVH